MLTYRLGRARRRFVSSCRDAEAPDEQARLHRMRAPILLRARRARVALGLGAALAFSAAFGVVGAQAKPGGGAPQQPTFNPKDFRPGQPIDNPYFPLKEGFTYHFRGKALNDAGQLVPSPDNVSVPHLHKQVDGIPVQVV